jgi:YD repeat-containing protein
MYGDYGHLYLLKSRKVTEYGEQSGSKDIQYAYNWDNYGNLKSFTNDGGGTTDDAIQTTFTYVADSSDEASAKFYRMKSKSVSGTDPLTSVNQVVASEKYFYDGHTSADTALTAGLLTRLESASGWLGGGESLTAKTLAIAYTLDSRGRVSKVTDEATGITMDQTYDFGGAVLKTQTNGLGQSLTRTIDKHGRVANMTEPNGIIITPTYDGFGRVTKKT